MKLPQLLQPEPRAKLVESGDARRLNFLPETLPCVLAPLRLCAPLLCLLTLTGCDLPGKPNEADKPVPAEDVLDFDILFSTRCSGCHGADGKLGPAPPLNDPLYLSLVSDAELAAPIDSGRGADFLMPAFSTAHGGPLSDPQVNVIVSGIRKRWKPDRSPAREGAPPPSLDSPATADGSDAKSGAAAFARACAGCHGDRGQGGKLDGRPIGAINEPAFLSLISPRALRRLVITGRPDLGMPDYAGTTGRTPDFAPLSSKDVSDIVAHLLLWRDLPDLNRVPSPATSQLDNSEN